MNISRRTFVQGAVAAGTAAAFWQAGCARRTETLEETETIPEPTGDIMPLSSGEWKPSGCLGCTSWCAKEVFVLDGRAIKVRANAASKVHGGNDCPRAHLAIQQVYDPDRIKQPMKRTNPNKGINEDPQFVPISWDEAMDMLADKVMELREKDETHKFILFRGRYTNINDIFYANMPKVIGSPNNISHSSICAEAEKFGPYYTQGYWNYRDYDVANTRYMLCWGVDPLCSNRQVSHYLNAFGGMLKNGVRIATVDPKYSNTAAKSEAWLPVKPGEDGALATAMAHVILSEGLWSREFVGDFTNGENQFIPGQTANEEDFEEIYSHGVVKWWNLELKDRTPEWAEGVCGVEAALIRKVAVDFASEAPHVMVFMGGGSNMQVRGAYNSMAVHALNGLVGAAENKGGTITGRSSKLIKLPAPDEYMDEIAQANSKKQKIDQRGYLEFPALKDGKSGGGVVTNRVADAILDEDPYLPKVAIGYFCNFNYSCPEPGRWHEAMSKLEFLAHCVTHYSEMSHFADILLPSTHHMFEQMSSAAQKGNGRTHLWIGERAIEPVYDVKNPESEVPWMLAEKLADRGFPNLLDYLKAVVDPETGSEPANGLELEYNAFKMLTQPIWDPVAYAAEGNQGDSFNSWEEFLEKGIWNSDEYQFKKLWGSMPTATGKFEFYSETLKEALQQHAEKHNISVDAVMDACKYPNSKGELAYLPHYTPPFMHGSESDYPFAFVDCKSHLAREGRSSNCSWFQEFKDVDAGDVKWGDCIKLNPADAAALGLQDGDRVRVTSTTGEVVTTLKTWAALRPGTASKTYGQGHWAMGRVAAEDFEGRVPRGANNNDFMAADYERLSGSTAFYGSFRVRIEKA